MSNQKMISMEEVARHNTPSDCWVVLCGKVYDLTDFHSSHPGGSKLITDVAGMDATLLFEPIHPSDIAERLLSPDVKKGVVDASTIKPEHIALKKQVKHRQEEEAGLFSVFFSFSDCMCMYVPPMEIKYLQRHESTTN